MPLLASQRIPDDIDDPIGRVLREMATLPRWTARKHELFLEFVSLANKADYIEFTGDFRDYHIEHKASHCLYDIPSPRRGALRVFAGQRIRLVCAGKSDRRAGRYFYAGRVRHLS
jgi:hypothetical protein